LLTDLLTITITIQGLSPMQLACERVEFSSPTDKVWIILEQVLTATDKHKLCQKIHS